jgi:hypothetical protein
MATRRSREAKNVAIAERSSSTSFDKDDRDRPTVAAAREHLVAKTLTLDGRHL